MLHLLLFLLFHVCLLDNVQKEECVFQGAPGVSLHILRDRVVHLHLKVKFLKILTLQCIARSCSWSFFDGIVFAALLLAAWWGHFVVRGHLWWVNQSWSQVFNQKITIVAVVRGDCWNCARCMLHLGITGCDSPLRRKIRIIANLKYHNSMFNGAQSRWI